MTIMTYAIVYSSKTGNTEQLAKAIRDALGAQDCLYFGPPSAEALAADRIFAGFWTNIGTCDEAMGDFLAKLGGKSVFVFGTAGFGGAQSYFDKIMNSVTARLGEGAEVCGTFMCQGRMPAAVRARYEAMPESPRRDMMIKNFDAALPHPDADDLARLQAAVRAL